MQKARVESGLVGAQEGEMFIKRHEEVGHGLFRTCANAMRRPEEILYDVLPVRVVEDGDRGDLRPLADASTWLEAAK